MIVYSFYRRNELVKSKVVGCYTSRFKVSQLLNVELDPETDWRVDKSKNWIEVSCKEGWIRYGTFWLEHEDDERAQKIFAHYKKRRLEHLETQIEKYEAEIKELES